MNYGGFQNCHMCKLWQLKLFHYTKITVKIYIIFCSDFPTTCLMKCLSHKLHVTFAIDPPIMMKALEAIFRLK